MYKIIAIDLDGTLLNSRGEVSIENKKAIKAAKGQGIDVVLASGRVSDSVLNIAKDIGADKYFICGNGSMIYDIQKDEIVYENVIDKNKILKLIQMCDENSIYYSIYTEDAVVTKSINYHVAVYNYENTKKSDDKKTRINIVEDVYKYVENSDNDKYLKMTICDNSKIIFNGIIKKFQNIPDIDILEVSHMSRKHIKSGTDDVELNYYYTEITNKNVDKWYAIEELAKLKNISISETMAIGDNMNDFLMIKNSGNGIAMGNGNPIVKEIADFVTKDNDEDGVAVAINDILSN